MALPSSFKTLTKTDRRKQWKILKSKHSSAIAKAKLDFDLKLGPALDKYQTQVDKLTKLAAKSNLSSAQIQPVLETAWPLRKIVASYHDKVNKLADPAKKELAAVLATIDDDVHSWEQLALSLQSQMPTGPTAAQKAAAQALIIPLDNIRTMALTIVTRGQRAKVGYEQNKPKARLGAAALAGGMVEAARLAGPSAHELANAASQVAGGSNYELLKNRAAAAAGLIKNFRDATQAFKAEWAITDSPNMTIMPTNSDAAALNGNSDQIFEYCDSALALIRKLP